MSIPTVPLVIAGVVVTAFLLKSRMKGDSDPSSRSKPADFGVLTKERQAIYEIAMNKIPATEDDVKNGRVEKLEELAKVFDQAGLKPQAEYLRRRSKYRAVPQVVHEARKEAYRAALSSSDKKAVMAFAQVLFEQGAVAGAQYLMAYAEGLPDAPPEAPKAL